MAMKREYKSDAFEAIHLTATTFHDVGVIDKATMRYFDESCVTTPSGIALADIELLQHQRKQG